MTAICAIISKAIFDRDAKGKTVGDVLPIDRYASDPAAFAPLAGGGTLYVVTARPGDALWLVARLDAPKLVRGQWVAAQNTTSITDLTKLVSKLVFASGKGIHAKPGQLGMSLQTPRAFADADVDLIEAAIGGKRAIAAKLPKAKPAAKTEKPAKVEKPAKAATPTDDRALVGAGKTKADAAAWIALEAKHNAADFPRLMAAVRAAQSPTATARVAALAKRKDPRIVDGLLAILDKPPYAGGQSKKFYQQVVAALQATNDARACEAMLDLSKRYKRIMNSFLGEWLSGAMARAAAKMPVAKAPKPAPAPKSRKASSLDQLFAAIVAAPDDDGPRTVYADALDDERGELIQLQLERAAGRGTPARSDRERQYLRENDLLADYALPLSTAAERVMFHRGFPHTVTFKAKGLAQVVDAKEWGTVRRLTSARTAPVKALLSLLREAPNLVDVEYLDASLLSKLEAPTERWTHLGVYVSGLPGDVWKRFPNLRELRLERRFDNPPQPDLLDGVGPLESLVIGDEADVGLARWLARHAPKRLSIDLDPAPIIDGKRGIEQLRVRGRNAAVEWMKRQPSITTLVVNDGNIFRTDRGFAWSELGALLDQPTLAKLCVQGKIDLDFERAKKGWRLVVPVADRWFGFYGDLAELAAPLRDQGVVAVTLHPERPRHDREPFADAKPGELEAVDRAWNPIHVERTEAYAWPDDEPFGSGVLELL